jgi:nicotinamidase/pyrazinamidase
LSQDWHPEHTPHFARDGGIWPVHCVANTWGAEFAPSLDVRGSVLRKGSNGEDGYSAFTMRDVETGQTSTTGLAELLGCAIRRVVVVGLATDYCVKATALDALELGFETIVLREGVRAVDLQAGDGEAALASIRDAGGSVI